jgi:hypothetical protein
VADSDNRAPKGTLSSKAGSQSVIRAAGSGGANFYAEVVAGNPTCAAYEAVNGWVRTSQSGTKVSLKWRAKARFSELGGEYG